MVRTDGSWAATYWWPYETALLSRLAIFNATCFYKNLVWGVTKVDFTYSPIFYFPGSLGFTLKHPVVGDDPSFTLMRLSIK